MLPALALAQAAGPAGVSVWVIVEVGATGVLVRAEVAAAVPADVAVAGRVGVRVRVRVEVTVRDGVTVREGVTDFEGVRVKDGVTVGVEDGRIKVVAVGLGVTPNCASRVATASC